MANAAKALPVVSATIGGKTYELVFSIKCFCLVEEQTGKSFLDGQIASKIDLRALTIILWAAAQQMHPELTLEEVRENLSMAEIPGIYAAITEGFQKASPATNPNEQKKTKK